MYSLKCTKQIVSTKLSNNITSQLVEDINIPAVGHPRSLIPECTSLSSVSTLSRVVPDVSQTVAK